MNLNPFFDLKCEIVKGGVSWNKCWVISFSILFKFKIYNERNNMIICQWLIKKEHLEPLIEWVEVEKNSMIKC